MTEPDHKDIGAYLLGLLEPEEADLFEEHLFGCDRCTAELDDLSDLPGLLKPLVRRVDEGELVAVARPSADLLPKMLDDVAAGRRRRRRRDLMALAAALVLIVAGPVIALAVGGRPGQASTAMPSDSVAAELVMMGERHTAADPATGVDAVVGIEQREWGTHIAIELSGLRGPLKCDLVAVGKDGTSQVVTNWLVPDHGYGVPGHPAPLYMHGGTSFNKADLDHVEVRTDAGKLLVSVPL